MLNVAYYRGELLDPNIPRDTQLLANGLTEQRIEQIECEAHITPCCDTFDDLGCTVPIVDFGVPAVRGYQAAVAKFGEDGKLTFEWVVWDYCPFCGKPLAREIHIGHRQTKMEDFSEQ